jgi:hypothetical protein
MKLLIMLCIVLLAVAGCNAPIPINKNQDVTPHLVFQGNETALMVQETQPGLNWNQIKTTSSCNIIVPNGEIMVGNAIQISEKTCMISVAYGKYMIGTWEFQLEDDI